MITRQLITFVISLSLIIPTAWSVEPTPTPTPEKQEINDTEGAQSIVNDVTGKTSQKIKGHEGEGFIELLTMLAMGFVAADLAESCRAIKADVFSPWIAQAGAATMIFAEINAWIAYAKVNKKIAEINSATTDVEGENIQKKQFELAKEALEAERKIVKQKKGFVQAAAVAYAAATAAAGIEIYKSIKEPGQDFDCGASNPGSQPSMAPSFSANSELINYFTFMINFLSPISLAQAQLNLTSNSVYKLVGITGATLLTFQVIKKESKIFTEQFIKTPVQRAGLFGAIGGLIQLNVSFLQNDLIRIDKNITTLENVIKNFPEEISTGIKSGTANEKEIAINFPETPFNYQDPNFTEHACIEKVSISAQLISCRDCKTKNSCSQINPGKFNKVQTKLPKVLNSAIDESMSMANSAGSGDFASAYTSANKLNGQAAQMKRLKDQLDKQINTIRAKSHLPPLDFENNSNQALQKLRASVRSSIDRSVKSGKIPPLSSQETPSSDQQIEQSTTALPDSGVKSATKKDDSLGDLDFTNEQTPEFTREETNIEDVEGLKAFGLEDIRKDADQNIFKILSTRYLKSYPRLLEEDLTPHKK